MNSSEYQIWLKRAFLGVEAALAQELLTPSRICMTEEYLRVSFVRGLTAAEPDESKRVIIEEPAGWTNNAATDGSGKIASGSPIRHDIAVKKNSTDAGMLCEVKWLKQAKASEIARDIWKLALSRSDSRGLDAVRTYLLVGGENRAYLNALETLKKSNIHFLWSTKKTGKWPRASEMSLHKFAETSLGRDALLGLLAWGKKQKKYYREPNPCLSKLRISLRAFWARPPSASYLVLGKDGKNVYWKVGLWELDCWGSNSTNLSPPDIRALLGI